MWMMRRPCVSSRAAAATTSITMNGGTLPRADGWISCRARSSMIVPKGSTDEAEPPRCCRIRHANARIKDHWQVYSGRGASDLTFASAVRGKVGSECQIRSTSKMQAKRPVSRAAALITAAAVAIAAGPARAQTAGIPVIRDAEIEQLLREYTAPIMRVAGLTQQNIHIVIINEKSFNAFVMDAHRIFVNSGALMQATAPNQLIGVFAHETGHIVGGHLSKMRQELANAQTAAIIAMLLGIGAVAAGAHSNNSDLANVGGAMVSGPQAYIMNTLLSYQRGQEESADRAGVRFLTMSGQSAKGMYDTFKRFADQGMFQARYVDPYAQNHPMPQERLDALATLVKTQYWDKKDPPELQFRHDMMRAKMYGFVERPDAVLRHYPF